MIMMREREAKLCYKRVSERHDKETMTGSGIISL